MALKARLRSLSGRPWLAALVIVAVVMTPGFYRLEQIIGEIRKTQQTGSPTLVAISEQQDDIEKAANSSTQLLDLILDCFDPESECAKEGAADRAAQVGAYNAAVIAAHYCTDQILGPTYTLEELTTCVGARLDGHEGNHR